MADPVFSPDGKWMWIGSEWIPAPPTSLQSAEVNLRDSVISGDIHITQNSVDDLAKAISESTELSSSINNVERLYDLGKRALENSQFEAAERLLVECLNSAKIIGDVETGKNVNDALGRMYQEIGDLDRAVYHFQEMLNLSTSDTVATIFANNGLAGAESKRKNIDSALKICKQNLEIAYKLVDKEEHRDHLVAHCIEIWADCLEEGGMLDAALDKWDEWIKYLAMCGEDMSLIRAFQKKIGIAEKIGDSNKLEKIRQDSTTFTKLQSSFQEVRFAVRRDRIRELGWEKDREEKQKFRLDKESKRLALYAFLVEEGYLEKLPDFSAFLY